MRMASVRRRLRDPVLWTDVSQLLKTVLAAVGAWLLARNVLGTSQPFLAPWAALLTVHATVYRTFARGAQQVGATVLGVLLAFAAGTTLGVNAASLGVVLLLGMVAGTTRQLRAESTTAATTALVVLLTGGSGDSGVLAARLLDTGVGIGVGLAVNLLVWPPLRDRSAARQVDTLDDRLGELLRDMAAELRDGGGAGDGREWPERTRAIEHEIDAAWAMARYARESGRLNPRRSARERVRVSEDLEALLSRIEQAVAETRSMARTIAAAKRSSDGRFRQEWIALLERLAEAIADADDGAIRGVRRDLAAAGNGALRPEQAALLVNLRNITDAMADVASSQPVRPRAGQPRMMPRRWRTTP